MHYRKRLAGLAGARLVVALVDTEGAGYTAPLALVAIDADSALRDGDAFQIECFGLAGVIVEYEDDAQALAIADSMHGCLVATIHREPEESIAVALIERFTRKTGRIVWNGWPTGVAVSPAQHHAGPHPSTTSSLHTSIGGAARSGYDPSAGDKQVTLDTGPLPPDTMKGVEQTIIGNYGLGSPGDAINVIQQTNPKYQWRMDLATDVIDNGTQ